MRLFVAIDVPKDSARRIESLRDESLSVRWTPPERFHLTLRFIGDVSEETASAVERALAGIEPSGPTTIEPLGVDVFPSRRNPRVLVLRVRPVPALTQLQADIETAVQEAGLDAETRAFSPHITLGRVKKASPREVRPFLGARQNPGLAPFTADAFHLYESTLHPEGSRHDVITSYPLSD